MSLEIIIPIFNEVESLKRHIDKWIEFARSSGHRLIFVDDGSTDNSREIINQHKCENVIVLHHKINKGYGAALKTGINASEAEMLLIMDADGQHNMESVDNVLNCRYEKDADLVVGRRSKKDQKSRKRVFAKILIRMVAKLFIRISVSDLNSGYKLMNGHLARKYAVLCPDNMAFSDVITILFIFFKNKVVETPISVEERTHGVSKVNYLTAYQTIVEIINVIILLSPLRIFLPISIVLFFGGLSWSLRFLLLGEGFSTGSILILLTSIIVFTFGVIAEQLSNIRKGLKDLK